MIKFTKIFLFTILAIFAFGFIANDVHATNGSASTTVNVTAPPICTDSSATNYGGALPCTYPAKCTDSTASNYGGALPCTYTPLKNGDCGPTPSHYKCSSPEPSTNPLDLSTYYWWACPGSNGGSTAYCTEDKVIAVLPKIDGDCGPTPSHYKCASPELSSYPSEYSTSYWWACPGSNGGSTAYCTENKPVATCTDFSATNYGGALPCTYPAKCLDTSATNYGGALPCTYKAKCDVPTDVYFGLTGDCSGRCKNGKPISTYPECVDNTCQDYSANNFGKALPCTYTATCTEINDMYYKLAPCSGICKNGQPKSTYPGCVAPVTSCPDPSYELREVACSTGYTGSITQERDRTGAYPDCGFGSWYQTYDGCTPTVPSVCPSPSFELKEVSNCPDGYTGSTTQERDRTGAYPGCGFGSWYQTYDGCVSNGGTPSPSPSPSPSPAISNPGGWSIWNPERSNQCNIDGSMTRTCTNPAPTNGGELCLMSDGITRALTETINYSNKGNCPLIDSSTVSSGGIVILDTKSIKYNSKVNLEWTGENIKDCTCTYKDSSLAIEKPCPGFNGTSPYSSPALKRQTTYTISCQGTEWGTATVTKKISVDPINTIYQEQ